MARLIEEARDIRAREPNANVLVYTEYTDSQEAVVQGLRAAIEEKKLTGAVLSIRGEDSEKVRLGVTARFQKEDGLILVSTDATAEGLNLHDRCHHLLHLELPYNPNQLEQRNGRIDRYGQTKEPEVRYLYLAGTFEERILLRLVAKYERQRARLTFVPNTLGLVVREDERATERLLEGLAEEDLSLFKREAGSETVFQSGQEDVSLPAYKDLLAEIEHAIGGFEKSAKTHAWLGDAGLNSETKRLQEATDALRTGTALGGTSSLCPVLTFDRNTSPGQACGGSRGCATVRGRTARCQQRLGRLGEQRVRRGLGSTRPARRSAARPGATREATGSVRRDARTAAP